MITKHLSLTTILLLALGGSLYAVPTAQPEISFTQGNAGTWKADWNGVAGRSYFFQASPVLAGWMYLPVVEFSDGPHGVGGETTAGPANFFRLRYTDQPTTEPALEDFAGDGIGSLTKVLMGLDPFVALAWVDTDFDGINDAVERFWFGNLTGTSGGVDDKNSNGIRDIFEIQAGNDPTVDRSVNAAGRSNYLYDAMGRLTGGDGKTYSFDTEGNLETISN